MAKTKNNIVKTLKDDVKVLSFQAGYNALKQALLGMVPDTSLSDEKLEGLIAGAVYYYFSKNEKYGKEVSLGVRLEALGDVIQVFGESIPFAGGLVKSYVSPYIEGDDDINLIEGLRDQEVIDLEGYDAATDSFNIQGTGVNIIESL